MVKEVVWSEIAELQIKLISELYELQSSKLKAKNLIKEIVTSSMVLKKFPELGTKQEVYPARNYYYRYILTGHYKLIYFISNQSIVIATVFDTRQNPEKLNIFLNENF
ncbi:type II toxin-antitoxin system RelE/ParE family toxin [Flavobacterium restrictum]|uniref:Type II toxin-antitoxin system RelE/ParE family toxin n=1 Tax=Flavobacterium restrictum TaxID=2594428 RepID=A0A553E416_9FLAO|nr:type II toxin-antitoxin system RelE/ParE family toxin [Flavobacterium restrictum]TRX39745.1 type II toxin-antitoxin system RelE/ParE family toxin [Flavobacterium restrictum]